MVTKDKSRDLEIAIKSDICCRERTRVMRQKKGDDGQTVGYLKGRIRSGCVYYG